MNGVVLNKKKKYTHNVETLFFISRSDRKVGKVIAR